MRSSKITAGVRAFFTSYCTAFIRQDAPAIVKLFAEEVHVSSITAAKSGSMVGPEWRNAIDHMQSIGAINVAPIEPRANHRRPSPSGSGAAALGAQW